MFRLALLLAPLVIILLVTHSSTTEAAPGINRQISFQGKMTNADGTNVPNGNYDFEFKLYDAASGGTTLWTDTETLTVTDGIFQYNLGSDTVNAPLPSSVNFNTDNLYLGITFNSDPDGEMTPRVRLTAAPYAFNADMIDGLDSSQLVQLSPSVQQTGSINISGNINTAGELQIGSTAVIDSQRYLNNLAGTKTSVVPYLSNTYTLGTTTNRWSDIYTINFNASGDITLGDANTDTLTVNATTTFNEDLTVAANKSLILTGGSTLPVAPTEGQIFWDSTNNKLYIHDGTKWQGDRSTATFIVAANDSHNKLKADFVADGTSDEDEINAAITAANSVGGGVVYLLEGTYTVDSPILLDDNVTLTGAGSATVITIPNSFDTDINIIQDADGAGSTDNNIVIRNLTIDGNSANQSAGVMYGIRIFYSGVAADESVVIDSIAIRNTRYSSVWFDMVNYGVIKNSTFDKDIFLYPSDPGDATNAYIANNILSNAGGIYLDDYIHTTIVGNTVEGYGIFLDDGSVWAVIKDNKIYNSAYSGIDSNSMFNTTISGNIIVGSASHGIYVDNGTENTIINNWIEDSASDGIRVGSGNDDNIISGNYILEYGLTNTASSGIRIWSGERNAITNNVIRDSAGSGYAIRLSVDTVSTYLADNSYSGAGASSINDNSTNTIYANQKTPANVLQNSSTVIKPNTSTTLTGTAAASGTTTLTGTSTLFTLELQVGDRITVNSETKTVTSIASDTSLTVDSAFTTFSGQSITRLPATLVVKDSSNNTGLIVNDSGHIGIGEVSPNAKLHVTIDDAGTVGQIIKGAASQSADLFQFQSSTPSVLSGFNSSGNLFFTNSGFRSTLSSATLSADRSIVFPNAAGTVCLNSGNCAGEGGTVAGSGTANRVAYWTNSTTIAADDDFYFDGSRVAVATTTTTNALLSVGGTAPNTAIQGSGLFIGTQLSNTASIQSGIRVSPFVAPGSASSQTYFGGSFAPASDNANLTNALMIGAAGSPYFYGSGTLGQAIGVAANVQNDSNGTITTAIGFLAQSTYNPTGTVTTNYGIWVEPQTVGAVDYGIRIDAADTQTLWISGNANNTTAAAGIAFGSSRDTNLYRSAANILRTDDSLSIGGQVLGQFGNEGAPGYSFSSDSDTGMYVNSGVLSFSVGGDNVLWLEDSAIGTDKYLELWNSAEINGGTLGLGTTSQAASLVLHDGSSNTVTLTASGISSDYTLKLPTAAGSTDQCLKTHSSDASQLVFGSCGGGGGGSSQYAYALTGDYNNNTTTFTDVDDDATGTSKLGFPVGANEEWIFIMYVHHNNNGSADSQWQVTAPSGATCDFGVEFLNATAGNLDCGVSSGMIPTQSQDDVGMMGGYVKTAGTSGFVQLQFRQHVQSGNGVIYAGSSVVAWKVTGADLAEFYHTKDSNLRAGMVAVLDPSLPAGVKASTNPYESGVMGVISTKPGMLLGSMTDTSPGSRAVPLALSGRVPVKVTTENGPIKPGDMLTSSSIPGVAMRATKAGTIIGQAMTEYSGEAIGEVTVYLKSGYGHGAGIQELAAGTDPTSDDYSKAILASLLTEADALVQDNLSEVVTDRLVAGLEIVTPRLTADTVMLNTLEAASLESIDINSDVHVHGTVFADKIKAGQIEGLELITEKISNLDASLANLGDQEISPISQADASTVAVSGLGQITIQSLRVDLNLSVGGTLLAGGLIIDGPAVFNGESLFSKLVTFSEDVLFKGRATFNNSVGGFATIKQQEQEVVVTFTTAYEAPPVVTATVRNGQFVHYAVSEVTNDGFRLRLDEPATDTVEFSWTAVAIHDPQHTQSEPVETD